MGQTIKKLATPQPPQPSPCGLAASFALEHQILAISAHDAGAKEAPRAQECRKAVLAVFGHAIYNEPPGTFGTPGRSLPGCRTKSALP